MNRPALRDPIAEIAMCLHTANAALPEDAFDDAIRVPFIRIQLLRALDALEQFAARRPTLKLVADGGDLGRAADRPDPDPPPSEAGSPVAGGSPEVVA
jgi:hypothetical protein